MRAPGRGILRRLSVPKSISNKCSIRLARHAQSLFTAAACLERAQVVLPGGDCAADLASATLVHARQ